MSNQLVTRKLCKNTLKNNHPQDLISSPNVRMSNGGEHILPEYVSLSYKGQTLCTLRICFDGLSILHNGRICLDHILNTVDSLRLQVHKSGAKYSNLGNGKCFNPTFHFISNVPIMVHRVVSSFSNHTLL